MTDDSNRVSPAVVIERSFAASQQLLWQMWTEGERFSSWYGPDGATIPVAAMDARVGGLRRLCMRVDTPDGPREMWFTGEYLEVVEHRLLVYTESMADEDGSVLAPAELGMPDGYPLTTQVTVELEDRGGHTWMVMTHAGIPAGSPGAAGWAMAFDKLDVRLGERSP